MLWAKVRQRKVTLAGLLDLPHAQIATAEEVMGFIERNRRYGRDVGCVDDYVLVAARLTAGVALWTSERRLHAVAEALGLAGSQLMGRWRARHRRTGTGPRERTRLPPRPDPRIALRGLDRRCSAHAMLG